MRPRAASGRAANHDIDPSARSEVLTSIALQSLVHSRDLCSRIEISSAEGLDHGPGVLARRGIQRDDWLRSLAATPAWCASLRKIPKPRRPCSTAGDALVRAARSRAYEFADELSDQPSNRSPHTHVSRKATHKPKTRFEGFLRDLRVVASVTEQMRRVADYQPPSTHST